MRTLPEHTTRLDSIALAELQSLPPALLRGLPLATMLTVRLPGEVEAGLVVVGDLSELADTPRTGIATFGSDEVEALACAVEYGRADAADVIAWVARKRTEPSFHLDLATALQGVVAPARIGWSLGRVLREVRAVVVGGALLEPQPIALPQAA